MKLSLFIFAVGALMFAWGLTCLFMSSYMLILTTQNNQPDFPPSMYFALTALGFMYAGRSFISAAWTIDKQL